MLPSLEYLKMTAFDLASRWVGVREVPGSASNPFILGMLRLDMTWPGTDEVAWCSAFANFICWQLRLPRSKQLSARSWLGVGQVVIPRDGKAAFDVVILKRGTGEQPGPEVLDATGHVGFFAGLHEGSVHVLGGNQGNQVSIAPFPMDRILGVRRLI